LSVIVPVYKKEKTITRDIKSIVEVLATTPYSFEVIPVVDGTNLDRSLKVLKKLKDPRVFSVGYAENRGKGYAVRYGMKKAKGQIVTFRDSGEDINPLGMIMLLEHMKWYNADIIIGSKLHPASIV